MRISILLLIIILLIIIYILGKQYIKYVKKALYYAGNSSNFNGITFNRLNKPHYVPKIKLSNLIKYLLFKQNPFFTYIKWTNPNLQIPIVIPNQRNNQGIKCYFINHSTVLLQVNNLNIITDPVYTKVIGLFNIGPKRVHQPGITLNNLPPIDIILLSHNHYDHMDIKTLIFIQKRDNSTIITPLGNDYVIRKKYKNSHIVTLDWGQSFQYNQDTIIYLEKAYHWSRHSLYDQNKALWGGFSIYAKHYKIYYSGDTAFVDGAIFTEIAKKHSSFDLALISIGCYLPYEFMQQVHINPEDAVKIHKIINAKKSLGIHWGTFQLSAETYYQPQEDLALATKKLNIAEDSFITLAPSELLSIR